MFSLTLALESSAKTASVALCNKNGLLAQSFQNSGLTHSRTLLPMVEDMLRNQGLSVSDLDLIAVSHGPGSFTGVRIGVSTVKGLAWAAEKPVCGVSTLEAMAYNAVGVTDGLVCCVMDARRGQFYNALFEIKDEKPVRFCEDRAIDAGQLVSEIKSCKKSIFVVGDGGVLCYNALEKEGVPARLAPEALRYQTAWGVLLAAQDKPAISANDLLPVYLRLSQAERERQGRKS